MTRTDPHCWPSWVGPKSCAASSLGREAANEDAATKLDCVQLHAECYDWKDGANSSSQQSYCYPAAVWCFQFLDVFRSSSMSTVWWKDQKDPLCHHLHQQQFHSCTNHPFLPPSSTFWQWNRAIRIFWLFCVAGRKTAMLCLLNHWLKLEDGGTLPAHPSSASLSSSSNPFRFSALIMVGRGARSPCRIGRVGRDRPSLFSFLWGNAKKKKLEIVKKGTCNWVCNSESVLYYHMLI